MRMTVKLMWGKLMLATLMLEVPITWQYLPIIRAVRLHLEGIEQSVSVSGGACGQAIINLLNLKL